MTNDIHSQFVSADYDTTLKNRCPPRNVMFPKNSLLLRCIAKYSEDVVQDNRPDA